MGNIRLFNIGTEFDLTIKPSWLDEFRLKYDKPYRYHLTLKTNSYYNVGDIEIMKNELANVANLHHPITVTFNSLFVSATSRGNCVMIEAEYNSDLLNLQKEIIEHFSKFGKHTTQEYKQFEMNFRPHITIARHLSSERLQSAKSELKNATTCQTVIRELILTTAKEDSLAEWSNPLNKIHFLLGKKQRIFTSANSA